MKKRWLFTLIGLGLSVARLGLNQLVEFSFKMRYERLKLETYAYQEDLRFAVVSDYRGGDKLNSGEALGRSLLEEKVDFVVFLGSLFHKKNQNEEVITLLNKLHELPIVYAPSKLSLSEESERFYLSELKKSGVYVLENKGTVLALEKGKVSLLGLEGKKQGIDSDDHEKKILPNLVDSHSKESFRIALGNDLESFHLYRLLDAHLILVGTPGKRGYTSFLGGLKRRYHGLKKQNNRKFFLNGVPLLTLNGFLQGYFLPRVKKAPEILIVEVSKKSNFNKNS